MSDLQEYKCPACGGALEFDSKSQKMKCPYCSNEYEVETLKILDEELKNEQPDDMKWDTAAGSEWQEGEEEKLHTFVCNSCGGEIIGDENMAATSCPYCGNPVVVMGQFKGQLKPDYVIPFKFNKKEAKDALRKYVSGKKLLPKLFRDENHLDEIKGIYVPFWLFDADVNGDIRYKATRVRVWSDSKFHYTETSYFNIERSGKIAFDNVPVDGSTRMDDDLMESIEPFDFTEAVDFQTAYLAGYLADKYDVDADTSIQRADARIKKSTEDKFADTVQGYATVVPEYSSVRLENSRVKYALYPVWILNTSWAGDNYMFAMNGQTGKFIGDLPVDKKAFWMWFFIILAIVGGGMYVLIWIIHMFT